MAVSHSFYFIFSNFRIQHLLAAQVTVSIWPYPNRGATISCHPNEDPVNFHIIFPTPPMFFSRIVEFHSGGLRWNIKHNFSGQPAALGFALKQPVVAPVTVEMEGFRRH